MIELGSLLGGSLRGSGMGPLPGFMGLRASGAERGGEMFLDAIGDQELRVGRPAVGLLRPLDLLRPQRGAVRFVRAGLLRGAVADLALDDDQRRSLRLGAEGLESTLQRSGVIGIGDMLDAPAEPLETLADVFGEGEVRLPLDRDLVVVVDPAEVGKLQVASDRGGFGGHALHEIAVAADDVGVVVEEGAAGGVVAGAEPAGGDRHPDGVAAALAEGAGGRLDPRGHVVLGVAGADAADLPEAADVVERHGRLLGVAPTNAGQMDERIEEHRRVAAGEHEAVAVGPGRVSRVVAEEVLPDGVGDRRQRHRGAGMAALGGFDRVHRQSADGVDRETVDVGGHGRVLKNVAWAEWREV